MRPPPCVARPHEDGEVVCAGVFAVAGMVGAFGGSSLSKIVDGQKLLVLFALLMLIIAAVMFARRSVVGKADITLSRENFRSLPGVAS